MSRHAGAMKAAFQHHRASEGGDKVCDEKGVRG